MVELRAAKPVRPDVSVWFRRGFFPLRRCAAASEGLLLASVERVRLLFGGLRSTLAVFGYFGGRRLVALSFGVLLAVCGELTFKQMLTTG